MQPTTITTSANPLNSSNERGWSIWKEDGWSMTKDEWMTDRSEKLHRAVLACETTIEAIPRDAGFDEEQVICIREIRKVDGVARRIIDEPGYPRFAEPRLRAAAWLEGEYWQMVKAA